MVSSAPVAPVDEAAFKVLSYNVWGIFNAKDNEKRLNYMAENKLHQFDIICLQECFGSGDFKTIEGVLKNHAFNRVWASSSPVGPGLALFTRYPILSHTFFRFPVKGIAEKFQHGDYYANKGLTVSRLKVPCCKNSKGNHTTNLVVYNTHLIAQYEKYSKIPSYEAETYSAVRLSEISYIASVIASTSNPVDDNILICGDFNAGPQSPEMVLLSALVERNAMKQLHIMGAIDAGVHIGDDSTSPSALVKALPTDTVTKSNTTYSLENIYNSSTTSYFQLLDLVEDLPAQLDHILFRPAFGRVRADGAVEAIETKLTLLPFLPPNNADVETEYRVDESDLREPFRGHIANNVAQAVVLFDNNNEVPVINSPMSDHWGVAARFVMTNVASPRGSTPGPRNQMDSFTTETFTVDAKELTKRIPSLADSREVRHQFIIDFAIGIINRCHLKNCRQFKKLMYLSVGVSLVAPIIVSSLVSNYTFLGDWLPSNFLCTVCGIAGLAIFLVGYIQRQYDAIVLADVRDGLIRATEEP